jgi:long-chain acyl-CoA synthetase
MKNNYFPTQVKSVLRKWISTFIHLSIRFFIAFEVEGAESVCDKGSVILTGNHTGLWDRLIVMAAFRRSVRFPSLQRGFGKPSRAVQQVVDTATEDLARGKSVCIFPQGRPRPDLGISFHPAVIQIQRETGKDIVPFAIHRSFRKMTVQFGRPVELSDKSGILLLKELHDRVEFMKDSLARRQKPRREKIFQESVLSLMLLKSDVFGSRVASCMQQGGQWNELTYLELSRKARDLSDYLIHWGLNRGDRVSILSESRPEWGIAYFATIRAGGVLVPLDVKLTSTEIVSILTDSAPRVFFVSPEQAEKAVALKALVPSIEVIILLDPDPVSGLPPYHELRSPRTFRGRNRDVQETALLIYTSGTTGNPKGVMITFGNLIYQVRNFNEILDLDDDDMYLSILPLNHLFELTGGFIGVLHAGGGICYSSSLQPQEITRIMREKKITGMITVPLFLKLLKLGIEKEIRKMSESRQRMFRLCYRLARWVPSYSLRKLLFYPLQRQLGGRMKGFISGGAPLDLEVGEFFDRIGIPVYQGYGLTETSPVVSVNTPQHNRFGSVGRPLKGVSVEILKKEGELEGEIVTRGPHIMKGYYRRPDLTAEVIDELQWFHTGDLGRLDKDGYLYITGRIKNMIVLGGGKKVQPEEVEACLSQSLLFKEICVTGIRTRDTEEVTAAIVPSDALLEEYRDDPAQLEVVIKKEVAKFSTDLAHYKRPSKIFLHPGELPKTATRKIKRLLVAQWVQEKMADIRPAYAKI